MSKFELKLPRMGESVAEATLTTWLKEVGDVIEMDEAVLEIATDKVDSEVPSEVNGILVEKRFQVDEVVKVGEILAVIEVKGDTDKMETSNIKEESVNEPAVEAIAAVEESITIAKETVSIPIAENKGFGTFLFALGEEHC